MMPVDINELIERLKDLQEKLSEHLDREDDFVLAVTIAVLESLDKEEIKE